MRSAELLYDKAVADPELVAKIKTDPVKELKKLRDESTTALPALQADVWIYRIVVAGLGLVVLSAVIGAIVLSAKGITATPQILTAIGSAAVGALAGLLAPSPRTG